MKKTQELIANAPGNVGGALNSYRNYKNRKEDQKMERDFEEYVIFHVTASDGSDVEMAVMDEFDFENEHYVVGAVVKEDTIDEEGRYIYKSVIKGDTFTVEKIKREFDYKRIAEAYMSMDEE